jgi:hypothetical protein
MFARLLAVLVAVALAVPAVAQATGARMSFSTPQPPHAPLTLVGVNGPIGGTWQRWVDEARVAVWRGDVDFSASDRAVDTECGATDGGCFLEAQRDLLVSPDRGGRFGLYHELGHLFDATLLTDADRAAFMRIWHVTIPAGESVWNAWWSGEDHADPLSWGPPGEWFAEGYRLCATYGTWNWTDALAEDGDQYGDPAQNAWGTNGRSAEWAWTIQAQRATCRLIDSIPYTSE